MGKRIAVFGLALISALMPVAVAAETIDVLVERPARVPEVYLLKSLSVDRFGGTDGRPLASAIERALGDARQPDGRPLFQLFASGAGEGAISGGADIDVSDGRYTEKRRLCPNTRNPRAECDDKLREEVELNCRSRVITLAGDLRVVRNSDGRVLASRALEDRDEARWCPGDATPPDIQSVVSPMIARAGEAAVADFVPFASPIAIRIREGRNGLSKELGASFKAAVLATRGDGRDGCAQFAALAATIPDHLPLQYNLALCAESRGELDAAADGFRRIGDREAMAAADRVRATQTAQQLTREREGARR